jgi:hypothetical protein
MRDRGWHRTSREIRGTRPVVAGRVGAGGSGQLAGPPQCHMNNTSELGIRASGERHA